MLNTLLEFFKFYFVRSLLYVNLQIFGPVLVAIPFRTAKEAQNLGNNTNYGLAASVWTENLPTGL